MKTDDYKQELHISATLHRTNAKIFFGVQKKFADRRKNSCRFFRAAAGDKTLVRRIAPKEPFE
jgi:hypothetical protein